MMIRGADGGCGGAPPCYPLLRSALVLYSFFAGVAIYLGEIIDSFCFDLIEKLGLTFYDS